MFRRVVAAGLFAAVSMPVAGAQDAPSDATCPANAISQAGLPQAYQQLFAAQREYERQIARVENNTNILDDAASQAERAQGEVVRLRTRLNREGQLFDDFAEAEAALIAAYPRYADSAPGSPANIAQARQAESYQDDVRSFCDGRLSDVVRAEMSRSGISNPHPCDYLPDAADIVWLPTSGLSRRMSLVDEINPFTGSNGHPLEAAHFERIRNTGPVMDYMRAGREIDLLENSRERLQASLAQAEAAVAQWDLTIAEMEDAAWPAEESLDRAREQWIAADRALGPIRSAAINESLPAYVERVRVQDGRGRIIDRFWIERDTNIERRRALADYLRDGLGDAIEQEKAALPRYWQRALDANRRANTAYDELANAELMRANISEGLVPIIDLFADVGVSAIRGGPVGAVAGSFYNYYKTLYRRVGVRDRFDLAPRIPRNPLAVDYGRLAREEAAFINQVRIWDLNESVDAHMTLWEAGFSTRPLATARDHADALIRPGWGAAARPSISGSVVSAVDDDRMRRAMEWAAGMRMAGTPSGPPMRPPAVGSPNARIWEWFTSTGSIAYEESIEFAAFAAIDVFEARGAGESAAIIAAGRETLAATNAARSRSILAGQRGWEWVGTQVEAPQAGSGGFRRLGVDFAIGMFLELGMAGLNAHQEGQVARQLAIATTADLERWAAIQQYSKRRQLVRYWETLHQRISDYARNAYAYDEDLRYRDAHTRYENIEPGEELTLPIQITISTSNPVTYDTFVLGGLGFTRLNATGDALQFSIENRDQLNAALNRDRVVEWARTLMGAEGVSYVPAAGDNEGILVLQADRQLNEAPWPENIARIDLRSDAWRAYDESVAAAAHASRGSNPPRSLDGDPQTRAWLEPYEGCGEVAVNYETYPFFVNIPLARPKLDTAYAIILDTSGSMAEPVDDSSLSGDACYPPGSESSSARICQAFYALDRMLEEFMTERDELQLELGQTTDESRRASLTRRINAISDEENADERPDDLVSLTTFNACSVDVGPFTQDYLELRRRWQARGASGSTPLAAAIRQATDALLAQRSRVDDTVLYVFTDGSEQCGEPGDPAAAMSRARRLLSVNCDGPNGCPDAFSEQ